MARILIADDEPRIAAFIAKGLTAAGYTTSSVEDGIRALDYGSSGEFDLLILDIGMPRMDGFGVLSALRAMNCTVPVIVLTARDSLPDTLAALDGGADDYMSKPFRFEELLSRIRLRLRDTPAAPAATAPASGDVSLDVDLRCANVRGRTVSLSAREFAMARVFVENAGKLLSREQLLSRVWGYDFDGSSNVVDVYVGYLRTKLGPEHFQSVRGAGYRFTPVPASPTSPEPAP
ncbi:DNA-binding response regulator, OmpR family, contains REC and winged-helix (wHTH) domain [Pseudarthrobacter equi]|uniref:DNA-binding response regulator, OmpR family, contains REC and winged-helix (WHTH) domain n=1 Tax=Pseudarthrobacter equi TaxID=728066 RepID=A0A1H2B0W5_9MICC|nr:response regulator transcription factor [Pseudarthrobacter equi]SDT51804.1 DNA-binding response regulator, OmpR family, contains REC and winged-helix (wHTH) domain [Pseudarthrobacter equi]